MAIKVESEVPNHHVKTSNNGHHSAAKDGNVDVDDAEYFMSDIAKRTGEDGSGSTNGCVSG